MNTFIKPIVSKLHDGVFVTHVPKDIFDQAMSKMHKSRPRKKEYTVVRSYTEDFTILKDGTPKCSTRECTTMREFPKHVAYVEKETRVHNSNFCCHDNFQSVVHVDASMFKLTPQADIVFEIVTNEECDVRYNVYVIAQGDTMSRAAEMIKLFENIIQV
jgi:hypothetical protein